MNKIINSDALEALRTLPDSCCRTCITSPPYYGLRDYGADGQIGLEDTPDQYIENLARIFREVRRVLNDDGTLWVNIGDSYTQKNLNGIPWLLVSPFGHYLAETQRHAGKRKGQADTSTRVHFSTKQKLTLLLRRRGSERASRWIL